MKNQKYLHDSLGELIDYLKQPAFIQTIKDVLDLVRSIVEALQIFAKAWIGLYQMFPTLTKWVVIGEMFFKQLGFLLSPITQTVGILSSFTSGADLVGFKALKEKAKNKIDDSRFAFMGARTIEDKKKNLQRLRNNQELAARFKRRFGWQNITKNAFLSGYNALSWTSMFQNLFTTIRQVVTSLGLGLVRALGFIVAPATLAAGALGGLAIAAGVAVYNFYKTNAAWQEAIKNSGVQFREELQKAWGSDTSLKDIFENIHTININSAAVNINDGETLKPALKISEDENLKSIYTALKGNVYTRTDGELGISNTLIKGVSKSTFEEAYNQYVAPMSSVIKDLPSYNQFLSYWGKDIMSPTDETKAAAAIVRAIIGQKGVTSGLYEQSEQKAIQLAKDFSALPISEQLTKFDGYMQDIMAIADAFNPKNHPNLAHITPSNFQEALTGSPAQYYEYWLGSYNSIVKFIEESPALKAVQAIHTLNAGVEEKTEEWWNAIIDIIGATSFNDEQYNGIRNFTIPVRNGHIDYEALTKKVSATGEHLNDNISTYMQWVSQIYKIIFSNEGIAKQLEGVNFPTEEEIIRRLFGSESLPQYIRDSMTPPVMHTWSGWNRWGGGDAVNLTDQRVNDFLGKRTNTGGNFSAAPTTPSPGPDYEWNPYVSTWVKKAGAPASNAPAATTTPTATTTPKPTAYNPSSLNSGYESSYAQNASRPTQVVINIDKLMDVQGMTIASDAEERQLAEMMEDKVSQALDILKGQIVNSVQSQTIA